MRKARWPAARKDSARWSFPDPVAYRVITELRGAGVGLRVNRAILVRNNEEYRGSHFHHC